jgi:hypothetical protein
MFHPISLLPPGGLTLRLMTFLNSSAINWCALAPEA